MQENAMEGVKERIAAEVERLRPRLLEISHTIHANPELGFEERQAAALLTSELESAGFAVERGTAGMETAFVATRGSGRPSVAFLAEYDALPKLGHACGHNLIAVWALGAGIALSRALPQLRGSIQVIGTPAEEGGGGKVIMVEAGIFKGLDAAIMMHPSDCTFLDRGSLAVAHYSVEFFGQSAHAAAHPDQGISALDALLHVFFSLNALRQMLRPSARVHGNITHGGDAPNVIPDYAAGTFLLRAVEQDYLEGLERRFLKIVEAAGMATGARSKATRQVSYRARVSNPPLVEALRDNMAALGIEWETPLEEGAMGSSDIGDVSQVVPTIHPYMRISEKGIAGHSPEFARAAISDRADATIAGGCALLACSGADVLLRPALRERMRTAFRERVGREPE